MPASKPLVVTSIAAFASGALIATLAQGLDPGLGSAIAAPATAPQAESTGVRGRVGTVHFEECGTQTLIGFGTARNTLARGSDPGIESWLRLLPWRTVGEDASIPYLRVQLGLGAANADAASTNPLSTNIYADLSRTEALDLIAFLERLDRIKVLPAPPHVTAQVVFATWGGFSFKVLQTGTEIQSTGAPFPSWTPYRSADLIGAINAGIAELDRLIATPPSVKW